MSDQQPSCDDRHIWEAYLSGYRMPAVAAADELNLFEALDEAPATAAELAARTGLREYALKALLPMLSALGFLAPRGGRYHLTVSARTYLLHRSPFYWGHAFTPHRGVPLTRTFIERLKTVEREASGAPVEAWESGKLGRDQAEAIARFMNSHSLSAAAGAAREGEFSQTKRLLDVGGGSGCFSIAFAKRNPQLHATVMELPAMCELVQDYVAQAGLSGRIDTRSVDMFREAWPTGYDAIFMSNIWHDWDLETNAQLAASSFRALPSGGKIVLHEMLINDEGSGPLVPASFSMMMLLGTKGRQYSFAELKQVLEGAGFTDVRAKDSSVFYSLVSATKP
ncbi:MAG TPA: methyltransferase [Rhizomicrobium sp.]|nr:methyltransferase [Rhizomicrobium sp.]